jgi:uncharacterized protein YdhG (YjbR/CyaY superfamily)
MEKPKSVDEYISRFPQSTQEILQLVRNTIKKTAPEAQEIISYYMPAYKLGKVYLVYFAGYEHHIGLYPAPVGMEAFKKEFSKYKTGKGSVQFPIDLPMPLNLITRIVKFRMEKGD